MQICVWAGGQVFKKHGLERYDPEGQVFDPNQHQAVFEVEDNSKDPGTIAVVMKVCNHLLSMELSMPDPVVTQAFSIKVGIEYYISLRAY